MLTLLLCHLFSPVKAHCRHCRIEVTTWVKHEPNPVFPIVAILVLLIFGYVGLAMCPVIYLVT